MEPHPQLPIICTSGLDWDVKVWVPSNENEPNMPQLENTVRRNYRCRLAERINSASDINESQMLWMLWRHLTTTEQIQVSIIFIFTYYQLDQIDKLLFYWPVFQFISSKNGYLQLTTSP